MGRDNQLLIGGLFAGLLLVGYGARCQTGLRVLVSLKWDFSNNRLTRPQPGAQRT